MPAYTIKISELEYVVSNCVIGLFNDVEVEFDVDSLDDEITVNVITLEPVTVDVARADCVVLNWLDADDGNGILFHILSQAAIKQCTEEVLALYREDREAA